MASSRQTTLKRRRYPVHGKNQRGKTQAILINSGNANAATGEQGYNDAVAMSRATAFGLGLSQRQVLVASTGKIGDRLPLEKIEAGIPCLISGLAEDRIIEAEEGIMTTDRFPKIEIRKRMVGARQITILRDREGGWDDRTSYGDDALICHDRCGDRFPRS